MGWARCTHDHVIANLQNLYASSNSALRLARCGRQPEILMPSVKKLNS